MSSLSDRIMEYAETFPEGAPLGARLFLHLGNRSAIDHALLRLTRQNRLIRIFQGMYVRTIDTRFGKRGPGIQKVIDALQDLWGQTIVPFGGSAASLLGLIREVPVRRVYLTSGPDRQLSFQTVKVDLRHAPRWQLVAPYRPAGTLIRALVFLGPREAETALGLVVPELSDEDLAELLSVRSRMPLWIAEPLSAYVKRH
ncbi:MAG: DUF6088 family protein [Candidatus Dadabacteria bacterium]|nr:DUF6088 family protein [Candidatus Dadabacteria bacterium]